MTFHRTHNSPGTQHLTSSSDGNILLLLLLLLLLVVVVVVVYKQRNSLLYCYNPFFHKGSTCLQIGIM
jgi:hypothetical protein